MENINTEKIQDVARICPMWTQLDVNSKRNGGAIN